MISALDRRRRRPFKARLAATMPAGPVALSRGPDHRRADARAGRRNHARKAVRAPPRRIALSGDGRDRIVEGAAGRLGAHRADDFRHARQPQEDRHRRRRPDHQGDRLGGAQGDRRGQRSAGAPLPVRQGARELARRSRALPRDGAGVPEEVTAHRRRSARERDRIRRRRPAANNDRIPIVRQRPIMPIGAGIFRPTLF